METKTHNVLYIDAWRDPDGGWYWNNWHKVGTCPADTLESFGYPTSARRVLRWMRDAGHLSPESARMRMRVEDDGHNIVIARRDGSPLFAIEYGE